MASRSRASPGRHGAVAQGRTTARANGSGSGRAGDCERVRGARQRRRHDRPRRRPQCVAAGGQVTNVNDGRRAADRGEHEQRRSPPPWKREQRRSPASPATARSARRPHRAQGPRQDVEKLTAEERGVREVQRQPRRPPTARRAAGRPAVGHGDDRRHRRRLLRRQPGRSTTCSSASSTPASTASHPDLAPNFNARLSRNFTTDIPLIDGDCARRARPVLQRPGRRRRGRPRHPRRRHRGRRHQRRRRRRRGSRRAAGRTCGPARTPASSSCSPTIDAHRPTPAATASTSST